MGWLEENVLWLAGAAVAGSILYIIRGGANPKLQITGPTEVQEGTPIRVCVKDPQGIPVPGGDVFISAAPPGQEYLVGTKLDVAGSDGCTPDHILPVPGDWRFQGRANNFQNSDDWKLIVKKLENIAPVMMRPSPGDVSALGVELVTGSGNAPSAANGFKGLARNISF